MSELRRGDIYRLPTGEIAELLSFGSILVTFRSISTMYKLHTLTIDEMSGASYLGASVEQAFANREPVKRKPRSWTDETWKGELLRLRRDVEEEYEEVLRTDVELSDDEKRQRIRQLLLESARQSVWYDCAEAMMFAVDSVECCYNIEPEEVQKHLPDGAGLRWKEVLKATFLACVLFELAPKIALEPALDA